MSNMDPKGGFDVAFFDFGGVIAHEGFVEGLGVLAGNAGVDLAATVQAAVDIMYTGGFLVGQGDEPGYWAQLRDRSGLTQDDDVLRAEVFKRIRVRPWMIEAVQAVRDVGIRPAILSDHTHWLDEFDREQDFFKYFDVVINSFYTGVTKRQPECFARALETMGVSDPARAVLLDDARINVATARECGLAAVLCEEGAPCLHGLGELVPGVADVMRAIAKRNALP